MPHVRPAVSTVLNMCGISVNENVLIVPQVVDRSPFLDGSLYAKVLVHVPALKLEFSSSTMSGLQWTAYERQKWPLLNLVRQILRQSNILMTPMRVSDGYNSEGKKLFRRMFRIETSPYVEALNEVNNED